MSCALDVEANPTNVMVGEALPDIFCPWMEPIVIGMIIPEVYCST